MKLGEVVGDQVGEVFPDLPVEFMDSVCGLLRGHGSSLFDEMSFFGGSSSLRAFLEVKKFFGVFDIVRVVFPSEVFTLPFFM